MGSMTLPEMVPCDSNVTMTATAPIRHMCPHRPEIDRGHITITWVCAGATYELHSLGDYIKSWGDVTISHEEITDRIWFDISSGAGIESATVETTWDTAAMEVRCSSTSPTRVGLP